MPSMLTNVFASTFLVTYKYAAIIPLAVVAQLFVGIVAGALARIGVFDVWILYACLVITAITSDIVWYWIGRRWGQPFMHRFGPWVNITPSNVAHVKDIFHRYQASILILSKITNGLGFAIALLFTAGFARLPFGRYVFYNVVGEAIWSAFLIGIGYYFGDLYVRINDFFGKVTLTIVLILVTLLIVRLVRRAHQRITAFLK